MPTKKPAPKKVAVKSPAKKVVAKKVVKPVAKAAAKKPAPKPVAKKVVAKPAPKPAAKKIVAKVDPKKVAPKPVPKKAVAKAALKKADPKPIVKKAAAKIVETKVPAKKVEVKKAAPKVEPKKVVVVKPVKEAKVKPVKEAKEKPVKEPKVKPIKVKKSSTPTKTVITSTSAMMPKKLDVYKTNTFGTHTLKNDSGKVIAHRKTSELKRKNNDLDEVKKYEPEFTRSILDNTVDPAAPSYRYSDEDLQEFRNIVLKKLDTARTELQYLQGVIMRKDEGGTEDTENKYQNMDDGSISMEREQFNQLAGRQITFIGHLEQALVRIENKTYGICRETGKLIDKARLRAVPHATLSIEAKNAKKN